MDNSNISLNRESESGEDRAYLENIDFQVISSSSPSLQPDIYRPNVSHGEEVIREVDGDELTPGVKYRETE